MTYPLSHLLTVLKLYHGDQFTQRMLSGFLAPVLYTTYFPVSSEPSYLNRNFTSYEDVCQHLKTLNCRLGFSNSPTSGLIASYRGLTVGEIG